MKRTPLFLTSASAVALLAFAASAQDAPKSKAQRPEYAGSSMAHTRQVDQLNSAAKASDLLGIKVRDSHNEKLGEVEELAVDVESGRILQVIVSVGGHIGIGETLKAVPPSAFHHDLVHKVLHLEADKETLKSAPRFVMSKWAESFDVDHLTAACLHYGQEHSLKFIGQGDANLDGQPNGNGQIIRDGILNPDAARNADGSLNQDSVLNEDGVWEKRRSSREKQSTIPAARLSHVQRATKLMGMAVKSPRDEKLGKIDNLLIDLPAGRVVAVVVAAGGFLGMGDELSAVPPTALRFNAGRDTLQLDATKETLSNAPHFKASQWPNFAEPLYASEIYRAYKLDPYFKTIAPTAVDNSAQNVRDRNVRSLTSFDQGNGPADVDTTAQIRKAIVADKDMSVNAKNVKVITNKGQVTLRGPVNTSEEKRRIGEIAARVVPLENVDNQLEVKELTNLNN